MLGADGTSCASGRSVAIGCHVVNDVVSHVAVKLVLDFVRPNDRTVLSSDNQPGGYVSSSMVRGYDLQLKFWGVLRFRRTASEFVGSSVETCIK